MDYVKKNEVETVEVQNVDGWEMIEENKRPDTDSDDSDAEVADEVDGIEFGRSSAQLSGSHKYTGTLAKPDSPGNKGLADWHKAALP